VEIIDGLRRSLNSWKLHLKSCECAYFPEFTDLISLSKRISSSLDKVHGVSYYLPHNNSMEAKNLSIWYYQDSFLFFSCDIQNFIGGALPIS